MSTPRKRYTEVRHYDDAGAVGRRLKEARVRAGMSQRQLSFPGCSPAYLSRIESGDRAPSLQLMRELARRLGVTEDHLAYGRDAGGAADPLLQAEVALRMDDPSVAEPIFREEAGATDPGRRAAALEGLGRAALRDGRPDDAIRALEEAASIYGDRAAGRWTLADPLGRAYVLRGDLAAAIAVFEHALRAAREREDVLGEVRFAVLLSTAYSDASAIGEAEGALSAVLGRADELADPQARVRLYWDQCRLHVAKDRPELAERYARKVIELLELAEDAHHLARAHRLMANVELDRGNAAEALELLERAAETLGNEATEAERATTGLLEARALAQLGDRDRAASLAIGLAGALEELPEETGQSYALLARTFADAGERERAIELYELACRFLERTPGRYLVDAYAQLAELLDDAGRKEEAFELLRKAVRVGGARDGRAGER